MFNGIKNGIASRLSPTREHLSTLREDLRNRLRGFRRDRSASRQQAMEEDFIRVLAAWGIEKEEDIPGILRELRLRCLIFTLSVVFAAIAVALTRSRATMLALILIASPSLLGILTTLWRMSILRQRAFRPFARWLLTGLFQKRP
jgi:hypothetical protein